MPGGDGTGPGGFGPMTGRAAGYCAGYSVPGYMNPYGFGGGGFGRGRGYRNRYYATGLPFGARYGYNQAYHPAYPPANPYYPAANLSKEDELNALKSQADLLKRNLEDINKAMVDLEKEKEGKE